MDPDERIEYVAKHTKVIRSPKQALATFGVTTVEYYLVTDPVYSDLVSQHKETVVREGRVIAEKPKLVTPSYLVSIEGFSSHAQSYLEKLMREAPNSLGLYYTYKNESRELSIVSEPPEVVIEKLVDQLDQAQDTLTGIIRGVDELWDVSLMKFISQLTEYSIKSNITEFANRGLLGIDDCGIVNYARHTIEHLFEQVGRNPAKVAELKMELDRWGLFPEYEDRFLSLFRK